MGVSSNSVFHFTSTLSNLFSILKNGFYPRYSLEQFNIRGRALNIAIPMVCFCDIPLTQISEHLAIYGGYGIGLRKDWAIKNRLNPILYLDLNSQLNESIGYFLSAVQRFDGTYNGSYATMADETVDLIRYIKPYMDVFWKVNRPDYCFYDEREWRYVPTMMQVGVHDFYVSKEQYFDEQYIGKRNEELRKNISLGFTMDDIMYIFIKQDSEKKEVIRTLKNEIFTDGQEDELHILISNILTIERLQKDF